jgi:hypothetical protein
MKKCLLILSVVLLGVSMSFSQTYNATLKVGDVDLTGISVGGTVEVPIYLQAKDAGSLITGFQFFVAFDHNILEWQGTYANPVPGVPYMNPAFVGGYNSSDWLFNDNGVEMVGLWLDPSFMGIDIPDGGIFWTYSFTLLQEVPAGGMSALTFTNPVKAAIIQDNYAKSGPTEMYDQDFNYFNFGQYGPGGDLLDGSIFVPGGSTAINWNGSVSTDWFDGNNWDGGVAPVYTDDVVIPATGVTFWPEIITNEVDQDVAECNNLTVENGASLKVKPFGFLVVYATFMNDGDVLMETNATDASSLICTDIQGTGNYEYDRYLEVNPQPDPLHSGWHYISSPVAGFGSYNMYDYYLNTWDEATSDWVNHAGSLTVPCTPGPEIFNDGMTGWSVKFDDMYTSYGCSNPGTGNTIEFMGPFNAGAQSSTITASNFGVYPNFNFVGNPYPSFWNYDQYWSEGLPTGLNDAIYFWDESADHYAEYVNGISNNGGSPYVPPAQGFFFEADGSVPSIPITFGPTQQALVFGLPYWKETATDLVRLQVSANGMTDQTTVRFNEDATVARDSKFDARKLESSMNLYTMAGNIKLAINQLPATNSIPVFFESNTSGSYFIEAIETSEFANVVLEDLVNGIQTDLLSSGYNFDYNVGDNAGRFVLHFTPLGTIDNVAGNITISAENHNILVNVPGSINGDIAVYNMMGQEVIRVDMNPGLNTIPMQDVNTYYIVKVISDAAAKTGKVFIR